VRFGGVCAKAVFMAKRKISIPNAMIKTFCFIEKLIVIGLEERHFGNA
jgi:hypothetical protein